MPVQLSLTAGCQSPCQVVTAPSFLFTLAPGQSKANINFTYQDTPGAQTPDVFKTTYREDLGSNYPVWGPEIAPHVWSSPAAIRCDNNTPNFTNPGCVVPSSTPTLVLPLSVYGGAAVNAWVGEHYLPGFPGLTASTPLTRGDPIKTDNNRTITCSGFGPFADPNPLVTNDSCDEYPFASTQQSGRALGIAGSNCLEYVPTLDQDGSWSFVLINKYTYAYPQVCLRGHVNQTLNSNVGRQALNPMYTLNRMMVGDPFTVQVID